MQAVIFAAGKGNRLKPFTDTEPKVLLPISGIPLLMRSLSTLPDEITEIIIVVNHFKEKVMNYVYAHPPRQKIIFATQPKLNGTWSALIAAQPFIKEGPFLVLPGDDLFSKKDLEKCISHIPSFGVSKKIMPAMYRKVLIDENHVLGLARQQETDYAQPILVATGAYCLTKEVFGFEGVTLIDGEIGLPHTLLAHAKDYPLYAIEMPGWHPVNTFQDKTDAEKAYPA